MTFILLIRPKINNYIAFAILNHKYKVFFQELLEHIYKLLIHRAWVIEIEFTLKLSAPFGIYSKQTLEIRHFSFFSWGRVPEGSKSREFQAPSVELRGFHGNLERSHVRPCLTEIFFYAFPIHFRPYPSDKKIYH